MLVYVKGEMILEKNFFINTIDKGIEKIFHNIIKYRYFIAIIVFIILVVFKVNGSSISSWSAYVGESAKSTIVSGQNRPIRSDEWEVLTPNILAQSNSDTPFSLINQNIATSGQNMVLSLGAPVKDIYTISKPLNWGYLFLGKSYGMSWYWNMKIILILLLSFELCMIITKNNKLVAFLGSFWLAFSPAVQWWFAQHVGDVTLYMEAIIVTFYYYFKFHDKIWAKIIFAFLFALSCIGYVFPIYPPLQVTYGYLALIIMFIIILNFRKKIKLRMSDTIIMICTSVFIILMLLHAYLISKDAISILSHTAYPGKRVSTGGEDPKYFFYSFLTNLFLPFKSVDFKSNIVINNCEISSFFNFLPAVILALPLLIRKKGENLKFGISLTAFSAFFVFYMYFKIPIFISKITLLSYVTGPRAMLAYAFPGALASIWALSEISRVKVIKRYYSIIVSILVGISYFICVKYTQINLYIELKYYIAFILILIVLNYLLLMGNKRLFAVIMFCVIIISGATVNPVNIGTGAIYNNNLSKEIQAIDKKDPGAVWMPVNKNDSIGAIGALIYANGANSLGGVNSYPDIGKWSVLDSTGKYVDVYNRSAHITFEIVDVPSNFVLQFADSFLVDINVNDIKKYNTKYIVSNENLEQFNNSTITFVKLYPATPEGYAIYSIEYK